MCNTAPTGPAPHIEPGSARPDTARTTGGSLDGSRGFSTISAPRMRPRTRPPLAGDSARRWLRR